MKGEQFRVIGIYLTPPFVYHQSILVPVKVDIDALIEVSQPNTFINPHFSVSRENLIHWLMILKMQGNNDTRQIGKLEIDIIDISERKCFVCSLLVLSIKNKNYPLEKQNNIYFSLNSVRINKNCI